MEEKERTGSKMPAKTGRDEFFHDFVAGNGSVVRQNPGVPPVKLSGFDFVRMTPEEFRRYLPSACKWVLEQERFILERGVRLRGLQCSDAKRVGVIHPERIRLLYVEQIPVPVQPLLRAAAQAMKLNTPSTPALALGYGTYIRSECWGQRWPVVHQLAHVAQFERLGSIWAFMECFLYQCLVVGYPSAPMEQEAIAIAQRICGRAPVLGLANAQDQAVQNAQIPMKNSQPRRLNR